MRARSVLPVLVISLAACGGGSAAPQPGAVVVGVTDGNHQVVPAAPFQRLPSPVVAQVSRQPNGQVSLRLLDAVLPEKAYAQTTVNGVAGQVVCYSSVDPKRVLRAEVPCASSDAQGHATFVLHTDSIAGIYRGQVAAALPTGTVVTDSVAETVVAGAAANWRFSPAFKGVNPTYPDYPNLLGPIKIGTVIDLRARVDTLYDKYGNVVDKSTWNPRWVFSADSVTISNAPFPIVPPFTGSGPLPVVPAGAHALFVDFGYGSASTMWFNLIAVP